MDIYVNFTVAGKSCESVQYAMLKACDAYSALYCTDLEEFHSSPICYW